MEFHIEGIGGRIRPASEEERERARAAIRALARPRLSGSEGAREVEAELRRRFTSLGYRVRELPFQFSTWPGVYGVPLAGGLYLAGIATAVPQLLAARSGAAALALGAVPAILGLLAASARAAIAHLPLGRLETANWLVHRPDTRPRYLIVAHRDTKSQAASTLLRAAAVGLALFAWTALLSLAGIAAVDPAWHWPPLTIATGAAGAFAGTVLLFCRAQNRSPGALDNASGLAALLGLARRERGHDDVAYLVTDGEELGLAGASAAAATLPGPLEVINLDGLDDEGRVFVVERFGWPRRGFAPDLAAALLSAAEALGLSAERRDLPLAMLVDHIPFVRAGHPAVTVMRGGVGSLRRVHRPDDDPDRLDGRGVASVVALVSGTLALLRGRTTP